MCPNFSVGAVAGCRRSAVRRACRPHLSGWRGARSAATSLRGLDPPRPRGSAHAARRASTRSPRCSSRPPSRRSGPSQTSAPPCRPLTSASRAPASGSPPRTDPLPPSAIASLATSGEQSLGPAYMLGMLLSLIGIVLLSIALTRAGVLGRWAAVALPAAWLLGGPVAPFPGAALILATVFIAAAVTRKPQTITS